MKPAPPVTRIFTGGLSPHDVPDARAGEAPRQSPLVALARGRLELHVDEIDDAPPRHREVLHAVRHSRRNAHEARGAVAQDEPARHLFRRRARSDVAPDPEHLVAGRDEPDVRLAPVDVEGLDRAGLHLAVVPLLDLEARKGGVDARAEAPELREVPAVVREALEVDELDALDGRRRGVVLQRVGALGVVVEAHQRSPTSLRSPSMKLNDRGLRALLWMDTLRAMRLDSMRPPMSEMLAPSRTMECSTSLPRTTTPSPMEVKGPMYALSITAPLPMIAGPRTVLLTTRAPASTTTLPSMSESSTTPSVLGTSVSRMMRLGSSMAPSSPVSFHQPSMTCGRTTCPWSMSHWIASVISSSPRAEGLMALTAWKIVASNM